ncbi:MAG: Tyrosine recombinase XerC [Bacteroidota bacterium]|jgi:integrase/recombinase XerC
MENFKDKFRDYLLLEKHYSPHTVTAYLNDLTFFETFLSESYGDLGLVQVGYAQIRSWIVSLSDEGLTSSSINRKISSLKSYYKFLLKTKQLESSPLLKHKALKSAKKLQIPFSEKEVDLVLNQLTYADGFEGVRDKLVIDLFYTTGIRRAELIELKGYDVDLSNHTIKVLGKRNKERIIPLLPVVEQQVKNYLDERARLQTVTDIDHFFLSSKGLKLNNSFVYRLINYYFSNVSEKVKKSPHILRHTFATHLLNNGADINSVKELLGHSSLASTQVYTSSSLAELKKVYGSAHPRNQQ